MMYMEAYAEYPSVMGVFMNLKGPISRDASF